MNELLDTRVLGAIRWVDAVTSAAIPLPLVASGTGLRFTRNLSGLSVIRHATGLEAYTGTFNLDTLPAADVVDPGDLALEVTVADPSGTYLPGRFTLELPRNPATTLLPPDHRRPPDSLFVPFTVALLPAPAARLPPGCAEVRVLILDAQGNGIRNALARVVATADAAVLGVGLSDARGETLVAIPGLKHFAPGATADAVVSSETEARLEIILPPSGESIVDWTALRAEPVANGNTDPQLLRLRPGVLISRRYPFPAN